MLAPGTQLGFYRLETLIGQGGMGHVYRAVDTRLDRVVAIKVLPPHLSSDPHLRERFEREARVISSLSHPNICTLYDVGAEEGNGYLVMEYVQGESLADRLSRGPLPLEQVLRYGREIADALAAAHKRGVIHRDLKPGNVMITKSGAKLLDFGLAKTGAGAIVTVDAPTEHQRPLTEEGTLLGTFQYMAPEQIEGLEATPRTDIFALGALLYEMVTGKRAFEGKSKASLIASILDREPPPLPSAERAAPMALDRLIRACLAKDPDERVQSARDVAMQLRWIGDGREAESTPRRGGRLWPWLAVAASLLLLAGAAFLASRTSSAPRALHLDLLPPPGFEFGFISIGPGGSLAFVGTKGNERHLFVRDLGQPEAKHLTQIVSGYGNPFWSPDGKSIAYFDRARLYRIPAGGGTPEKITDTSYGFGGTWMEDGRIVFTPGFFESLHVVPAAGGTSRPLTTLDARRKEAAHCWPVQLPDDAGILYLSVTMPTETSRIFHIPSNGGTSTEVIAADALVGYSSPFLLFARNAAIYAVRFDAKRRSVTGEPQRIAEQVSYHANDSVVEASVGADGMLVFGPVTSEKRRIVAYDRRGEAVSVLLEDDDIGSPRLSPDGKRLLLSKFVHQTGNRGIYKVDLERGTRTMLTPPPRFGFNPLWLADGERFAFTSSRTTPDYDLFVQADDPHADMTPIWEARSDDKEAIGVAPDGLHLLVREYRSDTYYDLWLVPISGKGDRKPLLNSGMNENWGDISPDGEWLVYVTNASSRYEVYVRPLAGGRSQQVSTAGGTQPRWSRDGREIFFLTEDNRLMAARFSSGSGEPAVSVPTELFAYPKDAISRIEFGAGGKTFLVNEPADTTRAPVPLEVVTGWKG